MERPGALSVGALFVLVLVITAQADDKCRTGCHGSKANLFKYAEGTTYKYNLESVIDISVSTAEGQSTSTKVKGTVLLTQQGDCNQILRLQNVQVIGPDAKKYDNLADIEKAIGLNFHDGHIEDVICTEPGDTQNSLNVKRAVASLFQAQLTRGHETDVFGLCPTDVSSSKEGPMTVIKKTRNLGKCAFREDVKSDFMATSFNTNSEIKSSPLLAADYESEQKIKNGVMDSATVVEHYLYRPFSDGKNGAKATVTTKLTAAGTSKDTPKAKLAKPRTIIFENPHPVTAQSSNGKNIDQALKVLMKDIDLSVSDKSAKNFNNLVKILRASTKDEMLTVYGQVKAGAGYNKVAARRVYLNALYKTQTGDSVEVGMQLSKSKELSPMEQKLLYLSLGFVRHATLNSVQTATELLDQKNLPRQAYLGIGALAGRYCKEHDCQNNEVINKLIQKMIGMLSASPNNRDDENKSITILKGLANIGQLYDPILQKVISIASDNKSPIRLRIAALETFLADACKDKLRDAALKILKDREQDSEIRIKAYLVVAQCPNGKVAKVIKELLDTEPVYQVGGFIVSHLRNIRASANPDKELAKQHLGEIRTSNKFPVDPRRYSYNNEFSYAVDTLGLGSSIESNVIYSQTSPLPRSSCMNLTAEMFGHTFNFLEIDARQENLDRLLEHYVGPVGVLSSSTPAELLVKGHKTIEDIMKQIKERAGKLRKKRDLSKGEIDAINKQVVIKTNKLNNDLDLDLSIKLFGSEVLFLSANEDIEKYTPSKIVDMIFDQLNAGIDKAKNFQETITSNDIFMDFELTYPTSMGYPLRVNVEGTYTVQIGASGQIDLRTLINNPKDASVQLQVIPSANIEVSTAITIDTHVVETGLKVSSSLHTSTGTNVEVKMLEHGKGVDVKFGLPLKKQEIISGRHDVVFETREIGKPEIDVPMKFMIPKKEHLICFDQLSPIVGLTFCGELTHPKVAGEKALVPISIAGNSYGSLRIEKDDMSEYHFRALFTDKPDNRGVKITIESLGEKKDKKVSLELEGTLTPEIVAKVTLISPIKTAHLEGRIINEKAEKSIFAKLKYDQTELYGKVGISVSGNEAKSVYKPLIEYRAPKDQAPQQSPYTVEGQIIAERQGSGRKYIFDNVKLLSPGEPPVVIQGSIGKENTEYFSGYSDVKVSKENNFVSVKGKIVAHAKPDRKLHVSGEIQNSFKPDANFKINMDASKTNEVANFDFSLIHGTDLNSKTNVLTISHNCMQSEAKTETRNKISYPLMKIDGKLNAKKVKNNFVYDASFAYDKFKAASELKATVGPSYDIDFYVQGLDSKIELKAKRDVAGDQSSIKNLFGVNGKTFEVEGTVVHKVKPNDVHVACDLAVKCPGHNEVTKVNGQYIAKEHNLDMNLKITAGAKKYIDMDLKAAKGGNINGHIDVNVPTDGALNGKIKVNGGSGTAFIVLDMQKMKRKVKLDSTFTIADPVYNVRGDLYLDMNNDPKKKISISTNNKIESNKFDSQNEIDILGAKLTGNVKGSLDGKMQDGKMIGEAEMILPNQRCLYAKFEREAHIDKDVANGYGMILLEDKPSKSAAGKVFMIKGNAKNVNFKEHTGEMVHTIKTDDGEGKTLDIELHSKRIDQGGKYNANWKLSATGSRLPNPVEASVNAVYKEFDGTYDGTVKYGPKTSMSVSGKYHLVGKGQPYTGEMKLEMHTPNEKYQTITLMTSGSLLKPATENDPIEFNGAIKASINKDNNIELNGAVKADPHHGTIKVGVTLPNEDPISVAVGYGHTETKGVVKCNGNVEVNYSKDKTVKADVTMTRPNKEEIDIDMKLLTPAQNAKDTRVQINLKRKEDGKHLMSTFVVTVDGKKYSLDNELVVSEEHPKLNIVLEYPDGKKSQISAKFDKLGPKKFKSELIIKSIRDFDWESSGEANLNSIEEFEIKGKVHSPKLKIENVEVEVYNKAAAKGNKKIHFSAKSGDKNILTGSTSYKAREEGGKMIVEGTGTFKVRDESQNANFKYIRQTLTQEKNSEEGIQIQLNAGLGSKAIDSELKITNKQFRILKSYCEEKKECAHIEIDSKTQAPDISEFNHELEIAIDLRKLGLSHEFGLKAVTKRKDLILDHTVDVHFQSDSNSKYQYSLYVHPKEAGVTLTTPKRVISIEGTMNRVMHTKMKGGKVTGELAIYLNKKNEPNQKTLISLNMENTGDGLVGTNIIDWKFSNPALKKDLTVKYNFDYDLKSKYIGEGKMEIDVFANKNQAIIVNYKSSAKKLQEGGYSAVGEMTAVSKGLDFEFTYYEEVKVNLKDVNYVLKYQSKLNNKPCNCLTFEAKANEEQMKAHLSVFNKDIYNIVSNMKKSDNVRSADTEISIIGVKPTVSHVEIKNYNTMKMMVYRKDKPSNKIEVNTGLIMGQIADFRAEVHSDGKKIDLIHATVNLDEQHFLKSDYGINLDNIQKYMLAPMRNDVTNYLKELKPLAEYIQTEISNALNSLQEIVKKGAPNFKPLVNYYQSELTKLRDELASDKTIKQVLEFLKSVFGAVAHTWLEIMEKVSGITEKVVQTLQQSFTQIAEIINKEVLPIVKEITDKVITAVVRVIERVSDLVFLYLAKVSELLKEYQGELKQIATSASSVMHDIGRFLAKQFDIISTELMKFWRDIVEQIKSMPLIEQLKEQWKEMTGGLIIPEQIINTIKEILTSLKDGVPTKELKELVHLVTEYIEKKLRQQPVDDMAMIQKIIDSIVAVFKHLPAGVDNKGVGTVGTTMPVTLDFFRNLPKMAEVKFSPLKWITSGDFPSPQDSLYTLARGPSWKRYGLIAQGQHIFTFDNRHLTFPATKCSYLLAKDALDGNFTLIGTFTNGQLSAISLNEKGETITIKKGGQAQYNFKNEELPIRRPRLVAYRLYESITMRSKAGVRVNCGPELTVCAVEVSAFYHGRMRGLLGNGNHEPYDDFIMPNGKTAAAEGDFGNSYKLDSKCPEVKTVDHSAHGSMPAECSKVFGADSSLRLCFPFVNPENFKMACEHGVAAKVPDTDKAIAIAYAAACNHRGILVKIPSDYVQCENGDKPMAVGEKFSEKTPGKAADIVLIVEQDKQVETLYKDLVQPMLNQLTNELRSKGINNVQFSLIGFGGEQQKWPSHYTVAGKMEFTGKAPAVKFTEPPAKVVLESSCPKMNNFYEGLQKMNEEVELNLGLTLRQRTITEAFNYPWRANAVKMSIALFKEPCPTAKIPVLQLLRPLLYRNKGIIVNVITPLQSFKITSKDDKFTKTVTAFTHDNVYTTDAKKKQGMPELRDDIQYDSDYCVNFALKSHGAVVVSSNFKPKEKKQFQTSVAQTIAAQVTDLEQGFDCECQMVSPYTARNVCKVVHTKDKVEVAKGGKKAGGAKG